MKVVVAIDSFKGSMTSMQAGMACKEGILAAIPKADVVVRPLADGGEGTVTALVEGMNGTYEHVDVTGPMGQRCTRHMEYLRMIRLLWKWQKRRESHLLKVNLIRGKQPHWVWER